MKIEIEDDEDDKSPSLNSPEHRRKRKFDKKLLDLWRPESSNECLKTSPSRSKKPKFGSQLSNINPPRPTSNIELKEDAIHRWLCDFASMPGQTRLAAVSALTEICAHGELVCLLHTIELELKRDFLALLPVELSLRILSNLSARDLMSCAQVSTRWRELSEDDLLWQRKCREAELDLPPLTSVLTAGSCRSYDSPLDVEAGRSPPEEETGEGDMPIRQVEISDDDDEETDAIWGRLLRLAPAKAIYLSYCQLRCHWRNGTRQPPHVSAAHESHVITCLEFYKNLIISASDDSTIELRNARSYELVHTLRGHFGGIWSSAVVDRFLVTGSTDRTLRVWDLENVSCVAVLTGHVSTVRCLASSGKRVVSGSRDTNLRVWDVVDVRPICLLEGHRAAVRCVQFRDNVVVSGSYDSTVRVWDVDKQHCMFTLDDHVNRVYTLLFDGDFIISGSLDTTIRVYNFHTGSLVQTLYGHQSLTSGMVLRRHQLISSNADGTVRVWDIRTGESSRILSGENRHKSAVTCVQLVMNFVVSAGDDGAVKLWDVQTGHFIRDLVRLDNSGRGGVVWRILANRRRLVCAAGSRNGAETTKLLMFDFEPAPQLRKHRCEVQADRHCYRDPCPRSRPTSPVDIQVPMPIVRLRPMALDAAVRHIQPAQPVQAVQALQAGEASGVMCLNVVVNPPQQQE